MEPFHGFLYVLKLSFQFFYSNISLISRNISTYPFLPSTMPLLFQLAEYQTQLYYSTLIFKNQKRKKKIHSSRATQELLKTSIDKKKKKRKKIPRWTIKVHYLRFVLFHNSLSIFEEEEKKIYRIKSFIVTRTITDRQETEVDSREREREKKTPRIFLARSERSNGVEREGILIWISNAAVTDHLPFHRRKFLLPLLLLLLPTPTLFAPTDRLEARPNLWQSTSPPSTSV